MKALNWIKVIKAEENDDETFYQLRKLIRVSDIRDIDELTYENDDGESEFSGCLINFYDGDSIRVFDSYEELYESLEEVLK